MLLTVKVFGLPYYNKSNSKTFTQNTRSDEEYIDEQMKEEQ